jgi:predicted DsbA family dithiol-disulfide isomerase
LKKEFKIEDKWLPFEIHPETPQEGILLSDYVPDMNPKEFFQKLDVRGKDMGIRFNHQKLMSNSRKALEGGEFAREQDRFKAYHQAVFQAYFIDCQDIGRSQVLLQIAQSSGLDTKSFAEALATGRYSSQIEKATQMARDQGIQAAPTFLIQGYGILTGAQPFDRFQNALRTLQNESDN